MRKLILSEFVSLDGVMSEPSWTAPYWGDDIAAFKFEELFASDALVLGRVTYEGFAAAWPTMTDEQGFADRMNSLPKFVASRTRSELAWNASVLPSDAAAAVAALKAQPGQDLLLFGSGELAQTLIAANLIDEYRLLVYPVVLGAGQRLFHDGALAALRLLGATPFASGAVLLRYEPASQD